MPRLMITGSGDVSSSSPVPPSSGDCGSVACGIAAHGHRAGGGGRPGTAHRARRAGRPVGRRPGRCPQTAGRALRARGPADRWPTPHLPQRAVRPVDLCRTDRPPTVRQRPDGSDPQPGRSPHPAHRPEAQAGIPAAAHSGTRPAGTRPAGRPRVRAPRRRGWAPRPGLGRPGAGIGDLRVRIGPGGQVRAGRHLRGSRRIPAIPFVATAAPVGAITVVRPVSPVPLWRHPPGPGPWVRPLIRVGRPGGVSLLNLDGFGLRREMALCARRPDVEPAQRAEPFLGRLAVLAGLGGGLSGGADGGRGGRGG